MTEILLQLVVVGLFATVVAIILFGVADALLKNRDVDWTRVRLQAIERRRRDGIDE